MPVVDVQNNQSRKFNMSLEYKEHSFEAILVLKRVENEWRIAGLSQFGLMLFDFSLEYDPKSNKSNFVVRHIIPDMKRDEIVSMLEQDFAFLLLPKRKFRSIKSMESGTFFKFGRFWKKTEIMVSAKGNFKQKVELKHPMIGVRINLSEIRK